MKIVFFGDSITDTNRDRVGMIGRLGAGYVSQVGFALEATDPKKYTVINLGNSGERTIDLYVRLSKVWKQEPDVLSILVGVNDVWDCIKEPGPGVDLNRYEKTYRRILKDTKELFPNLKIVLLEPFCLEGTGTSDRREFFVKIPESAEIVKKLAKEEGAFFLPLQEKLSALAEKFGNEKVLYDGVHPNVAGAKLIADEWLKLFKEKIEG